MRLLLTAVALAAFTHAAPTTHITHVGSNGIIGSGIGGSPLVSIVVNILKGQETPAVVPGAVLEPQPVFVVDSPAIDSQPVIVVDSEPVNVVDSPQQPSPIENPGANPIDVIPVSPEEPNPVDVVPVNPVAIAEPEPVQVVDVTPGPASVKPEASGNQIINVILNFVFGSDGSVSSVEVPAQTVQQAVGVAPRV